MKKVKIIYWISTVLFSGFMIFSSMGGILQMPEAIDFIVTGMGYPLYFLTFISYAKVVGSLTLFFPGYTWIKEWAYAGLFFDLTGAMYSLIYLNGFDPSMTPMFVILIVLFVSRHYNKLANGTK